jgi:hypothetical protein
MILTPALPTPYQANPSNGTLKHVKHCSLLQYAAENRALWKLGQKYLKRFDMWYLEKDGECRVDRCYESEVLHKLEEERNIPHRIKRMKDNWVGPVLPRNCLLKHVTEEKTEEMIEVRGRRGRRRK